MPSWLIFALLATLSWGLWGLFPKLAVGGMRPQSVQLYQLIGTAAIGLVNLVLLGFRVETQPRGVLYGILGGVAGAVGSLLFLFAVNKGRASVVVVTTALYPLVTITLAALLLREPITLKQGVGMALALLALVLMA
jgi:bacterial/archaeal transporter family protein